MPTVYTMTRKFVADGGVLCEYGGTPLEHSAVNVRIHLTSGYWITYYHTLDKLSIPLYKALTKYSFCASIEA